MQLLSALWRPCVFVSCDVATSVGASDSSDQGSLVKVYILLIIVTMYFILHNLC